LTDTIIEQQQTKKTARKAEEQAGESIPVVSKTKTTADPLDEVLSQSERAYNAYLEAQRKVAAAYKQRERQEEKTYKEVEQQANNACDAAIEKALRVREKAEESP